MRNCLVILAVVLAPLPAFASRKIAISVSVDGKAALTGGTGDTGHESPYLVWRYLKVTALVAMQGFEMPKPAGNPPAVVLKGDLLVNVSYGAEVKTKELRLIKSGDNGWLIDPAWIEANGPPGDEAEETRKAQAALREDFMTLGRHVGAAALACGGLILSLACVLLAGMFRGKGWVRVLILLALALCAGGAALHLLEGSRIQTIIVGPAAMGAVLAVCAWFISRRRPATK